jgi:hypothetical protein
MTLRIRTSSVVGRLAAATTLFVWAWLAQVQGRAEEHAKLPEGVTEITKEHLLTKVPNFFCFEYEGGPLPGKRLWLRVDDKHWVERYPDGSDSRYKIIGRMKIVEESGTVAAKIEGDLKKTNTPNDGTFYVFIPDKGNVEMVLRASQPTAKQLAGRAWKSSEMEKIE